MQKPVGLPQGHPSAGMGSLKNPGVQAIRTPSASASSLCLLPALLPQGLGSRQTGEPHICSGFREQCGQRSGAAWVGTVLTCIPMNPQVKGDPRENPRLRRPCAL